MRIAVVHSFYRSAQPSGENIVVEQQVALLRAAGHTVELVAACSDSTSATRLAKPRIAYGVARGRGADPTARLAAFQPDVVHVHNLFPNFDHQWIARWPGPVVATLHNFRPLCANGLLLRDGRVCMDCLSDKWAGVKHKCYRDSATATLPIAWRNSRGWTGHPLLVHADALVTLSPNAHTVFSEWGVPPERLVMIPHGVPKLPPEAVGGTADRWLAFGRLSPEKGLVELAKIWPPEFHLDIAGSGPLADELATFRPKNIQLLGSLPQTELLGRLTSGAYAGVVFAGKAIEGGYTLAAVESMAAGLPLVALSGGSAAQLVEGWGCGQTYSGTASSLRLALQQTRANRTALSSRAKRAWEKGFTQEIWLTNMTSLYATTMAGHQ